MNKLSFILLIILAAVIGGVYFWSQSDREDVDEAAAVRELVEGFGRQLQNVSLAAPEEQLRESIKEYYANYVSPELLQKWLANISEAPGRLTSSPWPDRIEVDALQRINRTTYRVNGRIIEITSVEAAQGGIAASRNIELTVEQFDDPSTSRQGRWLITDIELGEYEM